jgi:prepilin signal peptidase PulO-like enzyme (type II secretory pathway)
MENSFLLSIFVAFLGFSIGSFLNCLIYRTSINEKPKGRSYCPKCKHKLSYKDLVPVFSYILLLGKCRYCKKKISLEYPLVELLTGTLFLFIYLSVGPSLELVYLLTVSFFLIFIFVYDLKHYIIPDFANFSLIGISFFYLLLNAYLLNSTDFFLSGLLSAVGAFLFFFSLFYFTKGKGMGFGDVKFVIFMGFFLGFPKIIPGLFLSFFLGAIIGLVLVMAQKKKIKSQVPFAPFLIVGTLTAYFYGEKIIELYLQHLF